MPIRYQPYLPYRWQIDTPDRADSLDVFPALAGRAFPFVKSPIWSTKIATSVSGRERRAKYWSYPRWLFKINHDFLLTTDPGSSDWSRLVEFFCDHAGQGDEFYYYDPTDFQVTNQKIGVGDGLTVAFQLTRAIRRFNEPVFAVAGSATVFVDNVAVTAAVGENGVAMLAAPPAAGALITWTGMFMFKVRFDADQIDLTQDFSDVWSLADLAMRSIKPNASVLVLPSLNYALPSNSAKWLFVNAF